MRVVKRDNVDWYELYVQTCVEILKRNRTEIKPYKKLNLKDFGLDNYKEQGKWFYNRHHIDEINISGAILKEDKVMYQTSGAMIVNYKEHALLHYIIVLTGKTAPNDGMLNMMSLQEWDIAIKEMCKDYDVPYVHNWRDYLKSYDEKELELDEY